MKREILYLICIILFTSCSPQRRLSRLLERYPLETKRDTVIKVVMKDTVVYHDTIVYVEIKGDTIFDHDTVTISDSGIISGDTINLETEYAKAQSWISDNKLWLSLIQKESFIQFKLDSVIQEKDHWEALYRDISAVSSVPKKFIPPIYKVALWMWVGAIVLIILIIVLKLLKPM